MTDDDRKRYKTVDRRVIGFPLDPHMPGEMVKPGELIDIKEISPLTLTDRRIYNLLIANAWERITEPVEHVIEKSDLRGTHNGNERIEDSIRRLMSAIAEVKIIRDGKVAIKRVQLLGGNVEQEGERGRLYYTFPKQLIEIVKESEVFGRLKTQIMYCFKSKYALALYEIVQKRVGLKFKQAENFTVEELRSLLGVPKDKLTRFPDFNKYALQPALREVNALSEHHVTVGMIKNGKRVEQLMLMWQEKSAEEKRQVFREIERCSVGRAARIRNTVESVAF
ncbi:MAG: replication initiation protein [Rhodospirillales bacterium]|jgi:Initiator Replication protein.|nr:replication initiation protein [Rhodospirillales bacterium]